MAQGWFITAAKPDFILQQNDISTETFMIYNTLMNSRCGFTKQTIISWQGSPGTDTTNTYMYPWDVQFHWTQQVIYAHMYTPHTVPPHLHYCFILLHDWLSRKIKKDVLQCLLEYCKPSFLKWKKCNWSTKQNQYNCRIPFDSSVNAHVHSSHARKAIPCW